MSCECFEVLNLIFDPCFMVQLGHCIERPLIFHYYCFLDFEPFETTPISVRYPVGDKYCGSGLVIAILLSNGFLKSRLEILKLLGLRSL